MISVSECDWLERCVDLRHRMSMHVNGLENRTAFDFCYVKVRAVKALRLSASSIFASMKVDVYVFVREVKAPWGRVALLMTGKELAVFCVSCAWKFARVQISYPTSCICCSLFSSTNRKLFAFERLLAWRPQGVTFSRLLCYWLDVDALAKRHAPLFIRWRVFSNMHPTV